MIEFIRNETTLMAYVDGELDPALASAVEEAMKSDPRLLPELVSFIRSRRMARSALSVKPDTIYANPFADAADEPHVDIAKVTRHRVSPHQLMAAGIAVTAFFGGMLLDQLQAKRPLMLLESKELSAILNSVPTGSQTDIGGQTVRLVGMFKAASGFCREAEMTDGKERTNAVLCKNGSAWTPALTLTSQERAYTPAAGPSVVDDFLHRMGAERVAPDKEKQILACGL